MDQQQPAIQQNPKPAQSSSSVDPIVRQKIQAAKSTLGGDLKSVNVSAAVNAHQRLGDLAVQNPNAPMSRLLNRLPPSTAKAYTTVTSKIPSSQLGPNVPFQKFRNTLRALKTADDAAQAAMKAANEEVQLDESLKDQPPPMLLLKRVGIRIFPDGRRVAMYNNDRLGISFTIPFGTAGAAKIIPQATSPLIPVPSNEETVMESLDQVAKFAQQDNVTSNAKHFKFADGSRLKVSHGAAKAIHMVHGALNDENKKKFADMLNTPQGFEKAAHFALSKVNFTIGGK